MSGNCRAAFTALWGDNCGYYFGKVEKLNRFAFPIQEAYIEKFFAKEKAGKRELNLTAMLDAESACYPANSVMVGVLRNGYAKLSVV